jgi:outer membrane protein assembly factor BamA
MRRMRQVLLAFGLVTALCNLFTARCASADDGTPAAPTPSPAPPAGPPSPWMFVPVVSSSPKLGTAGGGLAAFLHKFDPDSRVSILGVQTIYTSTDSLVASAFARTSFGADHHRVILIGVGGRIRNDYDDYLGTGEPLQTRDEIAALALRYQYRVHGNWWLGAQGSAANYQVLGESAEDDLALETLGVRGFKSVGLGAVLQYDSRDNQDMPTRGIYVNANNVHYSEALGGADTFDAYRVDLRAFWSHGAGHVLALRQYNWLTKDAPFAAQSTVVLRGYKQGEFLAPYMSSLEAEYRRSLGKRWGATAFVGAAGLYGEEDEEASGRSIFPAAGMGLQFILKPVQRMLVNLEYAQGVEGNHGVYLKFGYAW